MNNIHIKITGDNIFILTVNIFGNQTTTELTLITYCTHRWKENLQTMCGATGTQAGLYLTDLIRLAAIAQNCANCF